ncbi:MAG: electron transfer flavoprotein subunit alpha [candidate division Zixibacteria bacterium HGW-Zixibacteria-1]|nr:MAG: electron transfer flavoprotein subunit alpha [candidate division Zixibacteria bacterium HGW-Zixibacteria-1]
MAIKVLTVAEQKDGKLSNISFELISVAKKVGGEIMTACLGDAAETLAGTLVSHGGGKVLTVSNPALKYYNDEIYARVITAMIKKYQPQLVIGPATFYGKALLARLAALNDGAMASDITAIRAEGDVITVTRPAYGGNVIVDLAKNADGKAFFITVRPKVFEESKEGDGEVVAETIDAGLFQSKVTVKEMIAETGTSVNLNEADIIVSVGRGIRGHENLPIIKKLADSLGAAVGASRAIVDAGWIEYRYQVGQTGKTVNPKLYFAVGISGAIQHLVGMQTSKTIVAINRDKDAPIFNIASFGIVGDLFEIIPALTAKFAANK